MLDYPPFNGLKEQFEFLSRHNKILAYEIDKILNFERLPEDEQLRLRELKAFEIARFAKRQSSFYRKLYEPYPLEEVSDFASLPVIAKKDIAANRNAICTTLPVFLREGNTSGTSGTPLTVYRSPGSIIRENAYVWQYRMSHGLNIGDPVVSLRGKIDRTKLYHYNKAENVLHVSCYLLSAANIKKYVDIIRDFKPKGMLSLPSSLYIMVTLMNQEGLDFHVPLVFTSSSTLYPFQRDRIEKTLKTKIFDWYGNAERTIALGECSHGNYHEPPMYSLTDFREDGVITTSLTNRSFPIIKYFVGDCFTMMDGPCGCGKGRGIKSIEGRFEDAVVLDDGSLINGLGIGFKGIEHLKYAQIIQEKVNHLTVNLVTAPGFTKADQELIHKRLLQRMNETVQITFKHVGEEDIIKTKAGKFTLVISRLKVGRLPDHLRTFAKPAGEDAHT